MAQPIYSERFLSVNEANAWHFYTVPSGHRAVLRNIMFSTTQGAGSQVLAAAAGVLIALLVFPATYDFRSIDCRVVVYAGETLGGFSDSSSSHVTMSGYLFSDTQLRARPVQEIAPPGVALEELRAR